VKGLGSLIWQLGVISMAYKLFFISLCTGCTSLSKLSDMQLIAYVCSVLPQLRVDLQPSIRASK
jgi:hypothetical protein